jgi:F1F0 ATPase subunit 2
MNETLTLTLALAAGGALGVMFFGGLWWTVRKALVSKRAALWFLGSMILRTSLVLTGFYFVGGGHWKKLVACLVGFIVARHVVTRLARPADTPSSSTPEAGHATQS